MPVHSYRRALLGGALVSAGLVTTLTAAAVAVPTAPAAAKPQYIADVMGPRAQPQPYPFGTRAVGIANSGDVLVSRGYDSAFLSNGRSGRALPSTTHLTGSSVGATVLTRSGDVYGGTHDLLVKRTRNDATGRTVRGLDGGQQSLGLDAANTRGDVAGCARYYRVSYPFAGSFPRDTITKLAWPDGTNGNCSVTGMSERGVSTINQEAPHYRHEEIYPRAATMTTTGVTFLRTPEGLASTADAISPDGTLIAGRVYQNGRAIPSWLSHRRAPVKLRGAGTMEPRLVTNTAVVIGVENGRVVSWDRGRLTDLTRVTRLPQGWVLTGVSGINGKGQFAVTATVTATKESVAMRLTPVSRR